MAVHNDVMLEERKRVSAPHICVCAYVEFIIIRQGLPACLCMCLCVCVGTPATAANIYLAS